MAITNIPRVSPAIDNITTAIVEHITDDFVRAMVELEDAVVEREQAHFAEDGGDCYAPSSYEAELKVTNAEYELLEKVTRLVAEKLGSLWAGLSEHERTRFVARNEMDIWAALERVADYQRR
jgi:hypothetical protein